MIEKIVQEITDIETRLKEITDKNDEMISREVIAMNEIIDKFLKILNLPEEAKNEFSNNFSEIWRGIDLSLRNANKVLLTKTRGILIPIQQLLSSILPDEENKEKDYTELICKRAKEITEKIQKETSIIDDEWEIELKDFFIDSKKDLEKDLCKFAGDYGINFNPESFDL